MSSASARDHAILSSDDGHCRAKPPPTLHEGLDIESVSFVLLVKTSYSLTLIGMSTDSVLIELASTIQLDMKLLSCWLIAESSH